MKTRTPSNHYWTLAAVGALLFATLVTAAQQFSNAEQQYRDALKMEQVQGDLNAAVKMYQNIVASPDADRAVKAKSLLQLAGCYEQLGQQPENVYRQILADFAEQPAAESARAKLAALARLLPGIYLADIDLHAGTVQNVRAVTKNRTVSEQYPTWSPDGRSIAFKRSLPGGLISNIVVQSLDGGREVTGPSVGAGDNGAVRWSSDGRSLTLQTGGNNGLPPSLTRYDLATGASTLLLAYTTGPAAAWLLSRDQQTFYGASVTQGARVTVFTEYDIRTGMQKPPILLPEIPVGRGPYPFRGCYIGSLSPDDRTIAFLRMPNTGTQTLIRVGVDGTGYQVLDGAIGIAQSPTWTPDGRGILLGQSVNATENWRIVRIPEEGGKRDFTGLEVTGLRYLDISPDGRRLVFDGTAYTMSAPRSEPIPR